MPSDLATQRKLIFHNLMNGVPVAQVAQAFHRQTEKEVMDDFRFVGTKIKSYLFERAMPHIPCDTVAEVRVPQNRLYLLSILSKVNLDVLPTYSKIEATPLENIL